MQQSPVPIGQAPCVLGVLGHDPTERREVLLTPDGQQTLMYASGHWMDASGH